MDCLNCGHPYNETDKFCIACGQNTSVGRLTIGHITGEIVHAITHADKGALFLVKSLALRPGAVAREYVRGKRKKYFNPFSFLLLSAAIFAFFTIHFHALDPFDTNPVSRLLSHYSNFILILGAPILAFFSWLFFRKSGMNFSESLVLNAFLIGEINLFYDLIVAPVILLFKAHYMLLVTLYTIVWTAYYCWAAVYFYDQKKPVGVIKGIIIIFMYQFFVGFLAYAAYYLFFNSK